jgi:single-strand DNA-binding protein
MKNINRVTIVGNIGNEPEVKTYDDGFKVVRLSVATTDRWTDKASGDRRSHTEWHQISIVNPAIIAATFEKGWVKKGDPVMIEGVLRTTTYEKDGQKHYRTEVQVGRFGNFSSLAARREEADAKPAGDSQRKEQRQEQYDDVPF